MTINISIPKTTIEAQLKPRITVIGVGGAGGNAVNNMIQSAMEGVDFVVANTDAQALASSRTDRRIQLGRDTTQGLGAGARPDIGRDSAEEALEIIARELDGAHMAFITAGMGGGTGTGAAPVIAKVARDLGVLTVGVVTKPFQFEGAHRMRLAEAGIEELAQYVDTLIVIPNQNLFRVANEKTTFADAFKMADDVLHGGVRSVTDLMMMPGMIKKPRRSTSGRAARVSRPSAKLTERACISPSRKICAPVRRRGGRKADITPSIKRDSHLIADLGNKNVTVTRAPRLK